MKTRSISNLAALLCAGLALTASAQDNKPATPAPAEPAKAAEPAKPAEPAKAAEPAKEGAAEAAKPAAGEKTFTDPAKLTEKAPEKFKVKLTTTKGDVIIECVRNYSPNGADRFYNLVKSGYFTDVVIFRVVAGFMAQFGIHGDPAISAKWRDANIQDDPVRGSNVRGAICFAKSGAPNSRSTQLFISYGNNSRLDRDGFSPFGLVREDSMKVWDSLCSEYGESPNQGQIQAEGNAYLKKAFPNLDSIKSATIVE